MHSDGLSEKQMLVA